MYRNNIYVNARGEVISETLHRTESEAREEAEKEMKLGREVEVLWLEHGLFALRSVGLEKNKNAVSLSSLQNWHGPCIYKGKRNKETPHQGDER